MVLMRDYPKISLVVACAVGLFNPYISMLPVSAAAPSMAPASNSTAYSPLPAFSPSAHAFFVANSTIASSTTIDSSGGISGDTAKGLWTNSSGSLNPDRMSLAEAVAPASLRAEAGGISPGAREAANLLGILPKVERLQQLSRARGENVPLSDEEMNLRVEVLDKVLGGSLEVRVVAGRIDRELSWSFSSQGMLQAKRQKLLNYLFIANFMQGGTLGVLSGPAFLHGNPRCGTELLLLASSIGLGLSFASLYEQKSPTKIIDGEPTVLANVFRIQSPEPLHRSDIVIKYMNSVPPDTFGGRSRIDILMDSWKRGHYLKSTEEKSLQKLAAIQPAGERYKENIGLIGDRIRMLFDTQWTIEQLDGELLELLRAADGA